MRFRLEITTDGAAFEDPETGEVDAYSVSAPLADYLRTIADRVDAGYLAPSMGGDLGPHSVLDINGNRCGSYELLEVYE